MLTLLFKLGILKKESFEFIDVISSMLINVSYTELIFLMVVIFWFLAFSFVAEYEGKKFEDEYTIKITDLQVMATLCPALVLICLAIGNIVKG